MVELGGGWEKGERDVQSTVWFKESRNEGSGVMGGTERWVLRPGSVQPGFDLCGREGDMTCGWGQNKIANTS